MVLTMTYHCEKCGRQWDDQIANENEFSCTRKCGGRLSIYSQDCPQRYHRRNPQRKPTGAGQWVPWDRLTADEQAVSRQHRGAIRDVRLTDIQLLEKIPPNSFLVNSGGELSGVTFQNVRQGDRVLASPEDLGLSVEYANEVKFNH